MLKQKTIIPVKNKQEQFLSSVYCSKKIRRFSPGNRFEETELNKSLIHHHFKMVGFYFLVQTS